MPVYRCEFELFILKWETQTENKTKKEIGSLSMLRLAKKGKHIFVFVQDFFQAVLKLRQMIQFDIIVPVWPDLPGRLLSAKSQREP